MVVDRTTEQTNSFTIAGNDLFFDLACGEWLVLPASNVWILVGTEWRQRPVDGNKVQSDLAWTKCLLITTGNTNS